MKEYKLRYLPIAKEDLFEIINYIQDVLQNPIAAESTLNKIETAILEDAALDSRIATDCWSLYHSDPSGKNFFTIGKDE